MSRSYDRLSSTIRVDYHAYAKDGFIIFPGGYRARIVVAPRDVLGMRDVRTLLVDDDARHAYRTPYMRDTLDMVRSRGIGIVFLKDE